MPYATPSALMERFDAEEIAQLADRSIPRLVTGDMLSTAADGGSLAAYTAQQQAAIQAALAVVNLALQDACDTINGYIMGRYTVPIVNPPQAIVLTECNLARYFLHDDSPPDQVQKRYEAAIDFVKALRDGKVNIGPAGATAAPVPTGTAQVVAGTPTFNNDTLADY